jgi:hypothetical protein
MLDIRSTYTDADAHNITHTRSFKAGLAIEVEQISLHTPPTQKHTEIDEGEVGEKHLV